MKRSGVPILLVLLGMGLSPVAPATMYCVQDAATLAAALQDAGSNGMDDEIRIAAGSYTPSGLVFGFFGSDGKSLTIEGGYVQTPAKSCLERGDDPALTVLDGAGAHAVLSLYQNKTTGDLAVRNLTLRNGIATAFNAPVDIALGDASTATLSLENAVVVGHHASGGFPAAVLNSATGALVVRNVVFAQNATTASVPPVYLYAQSGPGMTFNNVAVADNQGAGSVGGIRFGGGAPVAIGNSMFWGNSGTDLELNTTGGAALDSDDIESLAGTPDSNANPLAVDPHFAGAGDYRLRGDSPLRDAGNAGVPGGVGTLDAAGQPRIALGAIDIGAYELTDAIFRGDFEG